MKYFISLWLFILTIWNIENVPCWLLLADVENFTLLSRSLTSDKLAELIGGWVATCKEIIEVHSGMIDKYLGDGFFRTGARTKMWPRMSLLPLID